MIKVLIADDHTLMREGVKHLFSLVPDLAVAGEATNGAEVLDRLRGGGVGLVLLDMTMPGISGEDLIGRIRAHYPNLAILVHSMHNEPVVVQRALKAGANGYIGKDGDPESLLAAIRKVVAGGHFIDPAIAEKFVFATAGRDPDALHESLSDREFQVMRLLAKGMGVNEIAAELSISNKTVSTHKARMMEKMGFQSNVDLVRYAIANGLLD